jgi:hypothetical protein
MQSEGDQARARGVDRVGPRGIRRGQNFPTISPTAPAGPLLAMEAPQRRLTPPTNHPTENKS